LHTDRTVNETAEPWLNVYNKNYWTRYQRNDNIQIFMMNRLDNILEPDFEERGLQRPTSVARHVMSTTPKKCFDQVMNELRTNKESTRSPSLNHESKVIA